MAHSLLLAATLACSPAPKPKDIDLVLCLDVSNSMDGLIDSAKVKLWAVVNELATVKPTPNFRVGLYSYGHTGYPADKGWVRKDLDLTTDLDEVYAKLNALSTQGGDEYVGRVTRAALTEQKWSATPGALKIVFVCGNESASQDPAHPLADVARAVKEKGVVVNTIYCGSPADGIAPGWKQFADYCGGKFVAIDQDRAARAVPPTPFDKELAELSGKLNTTYVAFGAAGKDGAAKQKAQDSAAGDRGAAVAAERAASKATGLYRNSAWDLVDRLNEDPKFDVSKVKAEDLPEEMKTLKPEERAEYLKKKATEREEVRKKIAEVTVKRQKHLDEAAKAEPKSAGEKALDEALKGVIREQAAAKGFEVPAGKK